MPFGLDSKSEVLAQEIQELIREKYGVKIKVQTISPVAQSLAYALIAKDTLIADVGRIVTCSSLSPGDRLSLMDAITKLIKEGWKNGYDI